MDPKICKKLVFKTEEEWLKERENGLGGSSASAIIGCNPYMTNLDLFNIKTGKIKKPFVNNDYAKYGSAAEKHLIALFGLDYPQYQVVTGGNEIIMYQNLQYPFLYASLDAELIDINGKFGFLEIKTNQSFSNLQRQKWDNAIPQNYFVQVLHYFLVTGAEFCFIKAQLKSVTDQVYLQTKHYFIERKEVKNDLDYLLEKELFFWRENVEKNKAPNLLLPTI